jgi:hypothetical protein
MRARVSALLLLAACGSEATIPPAPQLDASVSLTESVLVSRPIVDFGEVELGRRSQQSLTLRNTGPLAVEVQPIVSPAQEAFEVPTEVIVLPPGGQRELQLSFAPIIEASYGARVRWTQPGQPGLGPETLLVGVGYPPGDAVGSEHRAGAARSRGPGGAAPDCPARQRRLVSATPLAGRPGVPPSGGPKRLLPGGQRSHHRGRTGGDLRPRVAVSRAGQRAATHRPDLVQRLRELPGFGDPRRGGGRRPTFGLRRPAPARGKRRRLRGQRHRLWQRGADRGGDHRRKLKPTSLRPPHRHPRDQYPRATPGPYQSNIAAEAQ